MIYRTDYHVHTTFSDGKAAPEDYVSSAINAGIRELGFSEHFSIIDSDETWYMNQVSVSDYIEYVEDLKKKTDSIILRTGLEIEFIPGKEKETGEFLDKKILDYRIGSVHNLRDKSVDHGPEFYEGNDTDALYESYFELVINAVSSGLFDIIGHCDLIRIFNFKPVNNPENLYKKLAKSFRKYNVAFELNTNGRNRPLADFYPDRRFLHIFREENIPVCVNSDAHLPSRVGQYFDEAYSLLKSAGYTEMAVFNGGKREMVPFKL